MDKIWESGLNPDPDLVREIYDPLRIMGCSRGLRPRPAWASPVREKSGYFLWRILTRDHIPDPPNGAHIGPGFMIIPDFPVPDSEFSPPKNISRLKRFKEI